MMSKRQHSFRRNNVLSKKPKSALTENNQLLGDNVEITDAMGAVTYIRGLFPTKDLGNRFPPIVFKHQLYTILENRTDVDKQVRGLIECGRVKMFQLGHRNEEYIIVLTTDFISYVQRQNSIPENGNGGDAKKLTPAQQIISRFLIEVVSSVSELSVNQNTMMDHHGFKDKDITELVNAGLLTVQDSGNWWFSVPGAGQFMKLFTKGRQCILRMVRSTKYKEILLAELKTRKPPASMKLGMLYHIHDLVGSDLIKCVLSTSGMLLRIIDD